MSLQEARKWISDCVQNYKKYNPSVKPKLLSDETSLHRFAREQSIRLYGTMSLPQNTLYITLSHCWGQVQVIILTQGNKATFESGVALDYLPNTYRDVILPAFWAFNTSGSTRFALYKIQRKTGKRSHWEWKGCIPSRTAISQQQDLETVAAAVLLSDLRGLVIRSFST